MKLSPLRSTCTDLLIRVQSSNYIYIYIYDISKMCRTLVPKTIENNEKGTLAQFYENNIENIWKDLLNIDLRFSPLAVYLSHIKWEQSAFPFWLQSSVHSGRTREKIVHPAPWAYSFVSVAFIYVIWWTVICPLVLLL